MCSTTPCCRSLCPKCQCSFCGVEIYLNLNQSLCCQPSRVLLHYLVCKKGLLVDQVKITAIIYTTTLTTVKSLCAALGHTCCRDNVPPVIGSDHRQSKGKITNLTFQNVVRYNAN
uniref:Uncharacterized protein n=1 Tax=Picea glauca TaxID=3330 RepID=A0A117NIG5_PICGL|nr:hypothetical protein ABT39_MTgene3166 [Picea glauca]QHR89057.1 hypothetical protein Q903MT_gene3076 [Picea sitchensis]